MAHKTLLDITQEILEEMGSDNVNSITDTVESTQVAGFVRQAFQSLVTERNWKFTRKLDKLVMPSTSDTPTTCAFKEEHLEVIWIKYNNNIIEYMNPSDFHTMIKGRDTALSNVDANGYYTDRDPAWWTSYDDSGVIFDAYDNTAGATLLENNLDIYAYVEPDWTHSDSFYPPVPNKYMKLLEDEARSLCYNFILKQPSGKVEQRLRNKRAQMQGGHTATGQGKQKYNETVNVGRK